MHQNASRNQKSPNKERILKMKHSNFFRALALILMITLLTTSIVPILAGCNGSDQPAQSSTNGENKDPTTECAKHVFEFATCTTPKTCMLCGATEGEPNGHTWTEATYAAPKTCIECKATEGEPLESPIPDDKNLAIQIDKIDIANGSMNTRRLRDIVVQFMYLQLNFAYTPYFSDTDSYGYHIKNLYSTYNGASDIDNLKIKFEEGKYYGGIPYMGNAAGSLYRWLEFYDPKTGAMDWDPLLRTTRKNWKDSSTGRVYPDIGSAYFGNTCASSCVWAWLRVSNSIKTFWTNTWIPANGFVKVGGYALSENEDHGKETSLICTRNGQDVMFLSYSMMKKADGLVQTGHAVMIVDDPVIVRKADGSIDGEKSYVLVAEQKASFLTASPTKGGVDLYSPLNDKGITYRIMGNFAGNIVNDKVKEMKWTFQTLYDKGYLPFTIPELLGTDPVEAPEIKFNHTADKISLSTELTKLTVFANYAISDIHINIKDASGNQVYSAMYCKVGNDIAALKYASLDEALNNNLIYKDKTTIGKTLKSQYADGSYTIEIVCRLGTGEELVVYTGTLTK